MTLDEILLVNLNRAVFIKIFDPLFETQIVNLLHIERTPKRFPVLKIEK